MSAENEEDKTKALSHRDRYLERIRAKYPDRVFDDDEALFEQINVDYDENDAALSDYKAREEKLSNLFSNDPRGAAFMSRWANGGDPVVELVRLFGDDFMEGKDDPEKQEALAEASRAYAERVSKEREFEATYETNLQETYAVLESVQSELNKTDDDIDAAMDFLVGIVRDGIVGKFTRESIVMAFNALNHDVDVEEAEQVGEVRGRNTKIKETLHKQQRGDGTASLGGKHGGGGVRDAPELGALSKYAGGSKTIWERGNEKRIKHR